MDGAYFILFIIAIVAYISYRSEKEETQFDGTVGNRYKLVCIHTDGVRRPSWFIKPEIKGKLSDKRLIGNSLRLVRPASAKAFPSLGFGSSEEAHKFMEVYRGLLVIRFGDLKKKEVAPVVKVTEEEKVYEI